MLKCKSDDDSEILEKLEKKKKFCLILVLVALPLTKQRMTAKQRQHFFTSVPRLKKYKTLEVNRIENLLHPLMQEFSYNSIKMENMQLIFAAKCIYN